MIRFIPICQTGERPTISEEVSNRLAIAENEKRSAVEIAEQKLIITISNN